MDGITDDRDSCVLLPGIRRYNGCPLPGRDGNGINDDEDQCVDAFGVKERKGCPLKQDQIVQKLELLAKKIFFETGKSKLLKQSFYVLDSVVLMLKEKNSICLLRVILIMRELKEVTRF